MLPKGAKTEPQCFGCLAVLRYSVPEGQSTGCLTLPLDPDVDHSAVFGTDTAGEYRKASSPSLRTTIQATRLCLSQTQPMSTVKQNFDY